MLVAAAVLPHPPLLLPGIAGDAASELDELRHACLGAIERLIEAAPDVLLVVGGADEGGIFGAGAAGSLSRFGLHASVRLPGTPVGVRRGTRADLAEGDASLSLPLSLAVAAHLLSSASVDTPIRGHAVDRRTSSSKAQYLGVELADSFPRVAMVVMGDGSACLDVKAPGYIVEGASEWQQQVDAAFASADFQALGQLTEADADRFWVAGRAAWQVLAGAAMPKGAAELQGGGSSQWAPALHYASAPHGVQYLVASFRRADNG